MKKILKKLLVISTLAIGTLLISTSIMAVEQTIVPTNVATGYEKPIAKSYSITKNDNLGDKYSYGKIIPIYISGKGTLELKLNLVNITNRTKWSIFADSACENLYMGYKYLWADDMPTVEYIDFKAKGTYYLRIDCSEPDNTIFTNLQMRFFPYADINIKSGQSLIYFRKSDDVYDFKFKAEKTGLATFAVSYSSSTYVTLLDSNKKAISEEEIMSPEERNNTFSFAVKKGNTYYLRTKTSGIGMTGTNATGTNNLHTIRLTNSAYKYKGGSKRSKAIMIKYKKSVKGLLASGDKAKFYKIKLKKGKIPVLKIDGLVSGWLKIQLLNKKGKVVDSTNYIGGKKVFTISRSKKLKKGTYYIKVSRKNLKSSGYFTIKNLQKK